MRDSHPNVELYKQKVMVERQRQINKIGLKGNLSNPFGNKREDPLLIAQNLKRK